MKITAVLDADITGALDLEIRYRTPAMTADGDDTWLVWDAISSDDATGTIYYDFTDEDFGDNPGKWTFWGRATWSDGRYAPGEPFPIEIYKEGY